MKIIDEILISKELQAVIENKIRNVENEAESNADKNLVLISDKEQTVLEMKSQAKTLWKNRRDEIQAWENDAIEYMEECGIHYEKLHDPSSIDWYVYFLVENKISFETLAKKAKEVIDNYDYNALTFSLLFEMIDIETEV